jgi:regulatory protein
MKPKRPFKAPTPQNLTNVALYYLQRFAASEASLRRVLENRLRRAAMRIPEFAQDAALQSKLRFEIENIIERHKKTGALNDAAFAETKVNSLRRQGRSRRMIEQKLAAKGLKRSVIVTALDEHADDTPPEEVEFNAALALAKKRRLGKFRQKPADEDRARKEFATLARAGFSSAIAKRVLQSDIDEDWE